MAKNKDLLEHEVVKSLNKKHDIGIFGTKIMELQPPYSKGDVGIKSRGKIDFLRKYLGYTHIWVDEFPKRY